jgi:hypothetical protein
MMIYKMLYTEMIQTENITNCEIVEMTNIYRSYDYKLISINFERVFEPSEDF